MTGLNSDTTTEDRRRRTTAVLATRCVVRSHVVTAVGVLRSRIAEPWTLNGLAQEVNVSRSQLVRAFEDTVGVSPMAYIWQMRAERMAHLLVSPDLSIADAARPLLS